MATTLRRPPKPSRGRGASLRDATFGFSSSNLREFVEEKSGGVIPSASVLSGGLDDIMDGGPDRGGRTEQK
jgi:hypothetical protein